MTGETREDQVRVLMRNVIKFKEDKIRHQKRRIYEHNNVEVSMQS